MTLGTAQYLSYNFRTTTCRSISLWHGVGTVVGQKIKNFIKHHIPLAVHAIKVVISIVRYPSSKRQIRRLLGENHPICIEVGAGDKKGINEWVTIDVTWNCDIYWDLRKGLPFPTGRVAKIYSSHFFEHLSL